MSGFELGYKGSIPLVATVKSFILVMMLDCESGNWVRIPTSPITFVRLTDKPSGYEPLITRSNRVQKTNTDVMELADIAVLETAALVHNGSTPFIGTLTYH